MADPKYIVLVAFDLLHLNGYVFRILPVFERKACRTRSSRIPTSNSESF
jgi:ATP-dependent DNA ligase